MLRFPKCFAGTQLIDKGLTIGFRYWGRCRFSFRITDSFLFSEIISLKLLFFFCFFEFVVFTRFPLITLSICTVIVLSLSVGIYFIEITTDPVELWAAPHSRSRQEKDYFDNTFGPFYRTAQIFIKPRNTDYVNSLKFLLN